MTGTHNRGTFSVNFGCDPQNIGRATRLVIDDLQALQHKPLDAQRLLVAKALIVGQLSISQESFGGVASQLLDFVGRGRPYDEDRIDAARQLTATGEQVRAALRRWIRPTDFVRVIEGPAG
jgi:zinc protease